ncbi:ATP-dependent helicase HepA [Shewanella putrefaciens]|nr:ATP-dependent helicase HepA [Shewanella putrefaciens]
MDINLFEGQLVRSEYFQGIGKIHCFHELEIAKVTFFESPLHPQSRPQNILLKHLKPIVLHSETVVYSRDEETGIWRRGRYCSKIPNGRHRVIFRQDDTADVDFSDIQVVNSEVNPLSAVAFLAARSNDAPYFYPLRQEFLRSYISQRAAVRSIKSISCTGIELEAHQLAVVRRVLSEPIKRFLLADEVGLGKTIEAAMVAREHLLEYGSKARILIAVPTGMIVQWQHELSSRFQLGPFINTDIEDAADPASQVQICTHTEFTQFSEVCNFTMIVIDEAHQVAPWVWEADNQATFMKVSECINNSDWVLLLSGTPLKGNEKNFLAMLHLLNPSVYRLDEIGVQRFSHLVEHRELLNGLFSAIEPSADNASLTDTVDRLQEILADDQELMDIIEQTRPLIDWLESEEGYEREEQIFKLRNYVGENYRLTHRVLRNRRESNSIKVLFPGLAGAVRTHWTHCEISSEYLFESYRAIASEVPEQYPIWHSVGMDTWLSAVLASPLSLSLLVRNTLENNRLHLSIHEKELLEELYDVAKKEQQSMDEALIDSLNNWLSGCIGKAVIFCDFPEEADRVTVKLQMKLGFPISRHKPEQLTEPLNETIRVLVCDHRGETGLNMHGGQRLAVHYSLPLDSARIEQRLGRFNRYSGNLHDVHPVESLVLLPERSGLRSTWMSLLESGLKIFDQSSASYQHALEPYLNDFWRCYWDLGSSVLEQFIEQLSSDNGLLHRERVKVNNQEQLLAMEEDVAKAEVLSEQIQLADEQAEDEFRAIQNWIEKGLDFELHQEDSGVRFRYQQGIRGSHTLVDIDTLIDQCILGFDVDAGYPPATHIMTPSRVTSSQNDNVYPLRYGQPFVDQIWTMLQHDPRGLSCSILRFLLNVPINQPKVFFHIAFYRNVNEHLDYTEQRIHDEMWPPSFQSIWVDSVGNTAHESVIPWLEKPYNSDGTTDYQDLNMRSEIWHEMAEWFPSDYWESLVSKVANIVTERLLGELSVGDTLRPIGMRAVILCCKGNFETK